MKNLCVIILFLFVFHASGQNPSIVVIGPEADFKLLDQSIANIGSNYYPSSSLIDIDGNGLLDLIIGASNGKLYRYEQGEADSGSFLLISSNFSSIDVGTDAKPCFTDIDGDGLLDLIIGETYGGLFHYEQNSVNSILFSLRTTSISNINVGYGSNPEFTDIDGDGLLDLIVGEQEGNLNHYEQNSANSTNFTLATENFNSINVGSYASPSFTDFENDGLIDLVIGEYSGNFNHYRQDSINSTQFTLVTESFSGLDLGNNFVNAAFCDIDNDGLLEMIASGYYISLYEQTEIDSIDFGIVTTSISDTQSYIIKSENLTGDLIVKNDNPFFKISLSESSGFQDSLVFSPVGGIVQDTVYLRFEPAVNREYSGSISHVSQDMDTKTVYLTGTGNIPGISMISLPVTTANITSDFNSIDMYLYSAPAFTDIDGDGLVDLLVGDYYGNLFHYEQDELYSESFSLITETFNSIDVGDYAAPVFTDLDGDSLLDLLIGEKDGNINHYEQDAVNSDSFTLVTENFNSISVGTRSKPCITDIDGDGLLDLLIGEFSGNINRYEQYASDSDTFTLSDENFNDIDIGTHSAPAVYDIDSDGLLDLLVGRYDGVIDHYEQTGINSETFSLITEDFDSINAGIHSHPVFADIDNDGLFDLFIGNYSGTVIYREQKECTEIEFGKVLVRNSAEDMYLVKASRLQSDISIDCPEGITVSLDGSGPFQSSLSLTPSGGSFIDTVFVSFDPSEAKDYSGDIIHSSTNMGAVNLPVTAIGINQPITAAVRLPLDLYQLSTAFDAINVTSNSAPAAVDIDRDGLLDLVIGNADGYLQHWEQDSEGSDTFSRNYSSLDSTFVNTYATPCFTDIDGDGLYDLMVGKSGGWIARYEQVSENTDEFNEIDPSFSGIDIGNYSAPVFADLDGDGLLDMLSGKGNGNIHYYEQDAVNSTSFTEVTSSFNSIDIGDNSIPTLTDLDGDGLFDLVIGKVGGYMAHYEQHEINSLVFDNIADRIVPDDLGGYATPIFCDLDKDGLLDMLAGHAGGNIYRYEMTGENGLDFGSTGVGSTTGPQKYLVSHYDLNSDLTITAPDGFTISDSENGTYGNELTVSYDLTEGDTVFVKFSPAGGSLYSDNITHSSSDLIDVLLPVTGTGILGIPQNISTEISGTDLIVSWDAVTGAAGYNVYSSDDPYGTFVEDTGGVFSGETWTIPYTDSKKFYYVVALDGKKTVINKKLIKRKPSSLR